MAHFPHVRIGSVLAFFIALVGCESPRAVSEGGAPPAASSSPVVTAHSAETPDPDRGRALLAEHECHRCHEGTGLDPLPPEKQCVGCHRAILDGAFDAPAKAIADWKKRIVHLRHVPSLDRIGATLREAWITSYLVRPHDVRPWLPASMPRLDVTKQEAADMAAHLTRSKTPDQGEPGGDVDRGKRLFEEKQCGSCHAFSGVDVAGLVQHAGDARRLAVGVLLAPDLVHTRQRMRRSRVAEWIRHPQGMRPGSAMPDTRVNVADSEDLAAFVLRAPLDRGALAPSKAPNRLPLLERPVTFDEVSERVFKRVCWHCHAQPDFARGDGGPGMSGGFGFAARRLDLSSYEALAGGYLDRDGKMTSAFRRNDDGVPMLVQVMLNRQLEEAGRTGEIRGMPLGLPSMVPEDIQLVASWIAQGRPQ